MTSAQVGMERSNEQTECRLARKVMGQRRSPQRLACGHSTQMECSRRTLQERHRKAFAVATTVATAVAMAVAMAVAKAVVMAV